MKLAAFLGVLLCGSCTTIFADVPPCGDLPGPIIAANNTNYPVFVQTSNGWDSSSAIVQKGQSCSFPSKWGDFTLTVCYLNSSTQTPTCESWSKASNCDIFVPPDNSTTATISGSVPANNTENTIAVSCSPYRAKSK